MDLSALVEEFLEYCEIERNLSPLTIRDYRHYLTSFCKWSAANSPILKPQDLTLDAVRKYRVYLAHFNSPNGNLPLKKVTQNYYVIALRSFLRYLVKKDLKVVTPDKIDDLGAIKLAREIADRIQDELKYPGEIKVNVIRELRAVEYAK